GRRDQEGQAGGAAGGADPEGVRNFGVPPPTSGAGGLAGDARPGRLARDGPCDALRQRHRRVDRPIAPEDRRPVRAEAAPNGPGRRVRARGPPVMRIGPPSIRAGLTLWHAGVLAALICAFSAGVFFFVKVRLDGALDEQLRGDLAAIEQVYREEPGDLAELERRIGLSRFEVTERGVLMFRTAGWPPVGGRYRIAAVDDGTHQIGVARDETPLRQTLWTLAMILGFGVPSAIGVAFGAGYVLAGRLLAPVGAMAETARRISAESLAERLPVVNPRDEL